MDKAESSETNPYELDPHAEAEESAADGDTSRDGGDETCTDCGAPKAVDGDPVCPGCGHDQDHGTVKGRTEGVSGRPAETRAPVLVKSNAVRLWLIMAGISTVILLLAWLAGWSSLFARSGGMYLDAAGAYTLESPRFTERILGVIRWLVAGGTLVGLGTVALKITAWISSRSVGSWSAAAARICWVVAIAGLATLIPIDISWLEWTAQIAAGCGLVAVGGMLVLGLRGSSLGVFMGSWALLILAVVPMARLVTWSFNL